MATKRRNNRTAGNNYERQIVNELKQLGFPEAVTARSESKNLDDQGVDICNTPGYHFQCKNSKTNPKYTELLAAMPTTLYTKDDVYFPVILHKKTKKAGTKFIPQGEFAILKKEDFYKLLVMAKAT